MTLVALARSGNLLDKTTGGLGAFAIGEADVRYCSMGEILPAIGDPISG